ncbi:MAG: hypothetical protein RLZ97_227 [Verrucomicrobiota bacterium]|jgi:subtilisin
MKPSWRDPAAVEEALLHGDGDGVKVAVIDSGIETTHPALDGISLSDDVAFEDRFGEIHIEENTAIDVFGHGTAVTWCVRKIAPKAQIGSFRVLNARNGSKHHIIRAGATEAIQRGYQVLNCSFGARDDLGKFAMLYKAWLDKAYLAGIHVVTACNNDDASIQEWPGFFHSCINVNMLAEDDPRFAFRPDHLVEFGAHGQNLELPWIHGSTIRTCGSSFAAPLVAGYVARLLSAFPDLTPIQAKALLQAHARPYPQASAS